MQRSKKLQATLLPTLLCLFALLVSACSNTTASTTGGKLAAAPASQQILRYADAGVPDFGTLDPALVQETTDSVAINEMFTGLVTFDSKGNVIKQMAASYSISPDGLTYTFHLKPNLKFSDGSAINTSDMAYSLNRVLEPATKSEVTEYLSQLKDANKLINGQIKTLIGDSINAPNDSTLVLTLSAPVAFFLNQLTYPAAYVVNPKLIAKYPTSWTDHLEDGGSSGPFKVASYSHTTGLDLIPNTYYYGPKPQLQHLKIMLVDNAQTAFQAYQNGQYDWVNVPSNDVPEVKNRPDLHEYPALVIRYVTMNYLSKPFDNIKIRQAFALALNKDLIGESILKGVQTPTNRLIPSGMYGASPSVSGPDGVTSTAGNQTLAKQLLKQGLQEERLKTLPTINFATYSGVPLITSLVQAMENQWTTVLGAKFNTTTTDFDTIVQQENDTAGHTGPLQMWISAWSADYPDPQDWLSNFFESVAQGANNNNQNYGQNQSSSAIEQQQVQKLLAQADRNTSSTAARAKLYNEAEQKIINDVGWIPIYQLNEHDQVNPKVQGWVSTAFGSSTGYDPDNWANIYIAK